MGDQAPRSGQKGVHPDSNWLSRNLFLSYMDTSPYYDPAEEDHIASEVLGVWFSPDSSFAHSGVT